MRLAIWRLAGAMKSDTVKLSNAKVEALGIAPAAKSRALKQLQESNLISVEQVSGKLPLVTLIRKGNGYPND